MATNPLLELEEFVRTGDFPVQSKSLEPVRSDVISDFQKWLDEGMPVKDEVQPRFRREMRREEEERPARRFAEGVRGAVVTPIRALTEAARGTAGLPPREFEEPGRGTAGDPIRQTQRTIEQTAENVAVGMGIAGLRAAATGARPLDLFSGGQPGESLSDFIHRVSDMVEEQQAEGDPDSLLPDRLDKAIRGAASSLTGSLVAGGVGARLIGGARGGIAGIVSYFGASEGSEAIAEGREAGLSNKEIARYATLRAATEALVTSWFYRIGAGGMESVILGKDLGAKTAREALTRLGRRVFEELTEENIIETIHHMNAFSAGVNPTETPVSDLPDVFIDTSLQTILATVSGGAGGVVQARQHAQAEKEFFREFAASMEAQAKRQETESPVRQVLADEAPAEPIVVDNRAQVEEWVEANPESARALAEAEAPSRRVMNETVGAEISRGMNQQQRQDFQNVVREILAGETKTEAEVKTEEEARAEEAVVEEPVVAEEAAVTEDTVPVQQETLQAEAPVVQEAPPAEQEVVSEPVAETVQGPAQAPQEAAAPQEGAPDLASMTAAQLRSLAKERGLKGYSGKNKAALVRMLEEAPAQEPAPQEPPSPAPPVSQPASQQQTVTPSLETMTAEEFDGIVKKLEDTLAKVEAGEEVPSTITAGPFTVVTSKSALSDMIARLKKNRAAFVEPPKPPPKRRLGGVRSAPRTRSLTPKAVLKEALDTKSPFYGVEDEPDVVTDGSLMLLNVSKEVQDAAPKPETDTKFPRGSVTKIVSQAVDESNLPTEPKGHFVVDVDRDGGNAVGRMATTAPLESVFDQAKTFPGKAVTRVENSEGAEGFIDTRHYVAVMAIHPKAELRWNGKTKSPVYFVVDGVPVAVVAQSKGARSVLSAAVHQMRVEVPGFTPDPPPKGIQNAFNPVPGYRNTSEHPTVDHAVFTLPDIVRLLREVAGTVPAVVRRMKALGQAKGRHVKMRHDVAIGPIITSGEVKTANKDEIISQITEQVLENTGLTEDQIHVREEPSRRQGRTQVFVHKIDPDFAATVLAHEVGHVGDFLPQETMKRGNVLGRIASLTNWLRHTMSEVESNPIDSLTPKDRAQARKKARARAAEEVDPDDKEGLKELTKAYYQEEVQDLIDERGLVDVQTIMDELKELTLWWNPFDPKTSDPGYVRYRFSGKELYAEAISVMLNNPTALMERAPTFYRAFVGWLDAKPEMRASYDAIVRDIEQNRTGDKLDARLIEGMRKGDEALGRREDARQEKPDMPWYRWAGSLIRSKFNYIRSTQFADERAGRIERGEGPIDLIDAAVYSTARNEYYASKMRREVTDYLREQGVSWDDFGLFGFYNRVRTERAMVFNPEGVTRPIAEERLRAMKERLGEEGWKALHEAHKRFVQIREDSVITIFADEEIFSKELLDKMQTNEEYLRFEVVEYIEQALGYGKGSGLKIWRQFGTMKEVANPYTATLAKDMAMMKAAAWNSARRATIEWLGDIHPELIDFNVEKKFDRNVNRMVIQEPSDPKYVLITYMKHGKIEGAYVVKEIGEPLMNFRFPEELGMVARLLHSMAMPFKRAFTSLRPGFVLVTNPVRDFLRAATSTPDIRITQFIPWYFKGLAEAFRANMLSIPDTVQDEMLKKNLLISWAEWDPTNTAELKTHERLLAQYTNATAFHNRFVRPFAAVLRFVDQLNSTIERAPKIGAYKYLKEKTTFSDEYIARIIRHNAGSPSFITRGHLTPYLNNIFIFSNPMIQAYASDIEMARAHKDVRYKMLAYSVLPRLPQIAIASGALVFALKRMGFDDDDEFMQWAQSAENAYRNLSTYILTNYLVLPLGFDENGKTVYFRIPQDETQRFIGGLFSIAADAVFNDEIDWKDRAEGIPRALSYAGEQLPNSHPLLTVGSATFQYITGSNPRDSFRGRPYVPERIFRAGGRESHIAFAKTAANELGLMGAFHVFQTGDPSEVRTWLEKSLGFPIASDTVRRFLRVSDAGKGEYARRVVEQQRSIRQRELNEIRNIVRRDLRGDPIQPWEKDLLEAESRYVNQVTPTEQAKIFGDTWERQLAFASTRAERDAIHMAMMRREGRDFNIVPYIESDIRTMANRLISPSTPPEELEEILAWFRERRVPAAEIGRIMEAEIAQLKTFQGRMDKRRRLNRALSRL